MFVPSTIAWSTSTTLDWSSLAVLICAVASFTALSVSATSRRTSGPMRYLWLGVAATATGFGIWATHFIAMLAFAPGVAVRLQHRA